MVRCRCMLCLRTIGYAQSRQEAALPPTTVASAHSTRKDPYRALDRSYQIRIHRTLSGGHSLRFAAYRRRDCGPTTHGQRAARPSIGTSRAESSGARQRRPSCERDRSRPTGDYGSPPRYSLRQHSLNQRSREAKAWLKRRAFLLWRPPVCQVADPLSPNPARFIRRAKAKKLRSNLCPNP